MIYFVQAEGGGPIKIGTTIRLSERLKMLSKETGRDLYVMAVMSGGTDEEKSLHRRFADHRVGESVLSEWFSPHDDLLDLIAIEGRRWDPSERLRPIRLDLSPKMYRILRLVSADEGVSMAQYARDGLERILREEADRRGIKPLWSPK